MIDPPSAHPRLERIARGVIEANKYMTLATADGPGRPWASPVYYTPEGYDVFYWASSPGSVHSRNLAQRPELSIVIFDSQAQIGTAEAVYMVARADIVPDDELERCAATYGSRFPELRVFRPHELRAPAEPPRPRRRHPRAARSCSTPACRGSARRRTSSPSSERPRRRPRRRSRCRPAQRAPRHRRVASERRISHRSSGRGAGRRAWRSPRPWRRPLPRPSSSPTIRPARNPPWGPPRDRRATA